MPLTSLLMPVPHLYSSVSFEMLIVSMPWCCPTVTFLVFLYDAVKSSGCLVTFWCSSNDNWSSFWCCATLHRMASLALIELWVSECNQLAVMHELSIIFTQTIGDCHVKNYINELLSTLVRQHFTVWHILKIFIFSTQCQNWKLSDVA